MAQAERANPDIGELLERLLCTGSLDCFMSENEEYLRLPPLHVFLNSLCEERGLVHERVILAADIERTYGHQIFRGMRIPSRDKLLQLAFGLGLSFEETQQLLQIGQKPPLCIKIKRDAVIAYCLIHQLTVIGTQVLLEERGLTILGGCSG